jgi:5-methylcytosine-specific restriction protein A
MADTVEQHRATQGDWCPGYGIPAHPSFDLTADHVIARAHGGTGGPLAVLCRQCNSRRGTRD